MGVMAMISAALRSVQSVEYRPTTRYRADWSVFRFGVEMKVVANRNSFQVLTNWKIVIVATPGRARGKKMRTNTPRSEQPSIFPASANSFGSVLKKARIRKIAKGTLPPRYDNESPGSVFRRPICLRK